MGYEVVIAKTADLEYQETLSYFAREFASPQAMRNLTDELANAKRALASVPNWFPIHRGASSATGKVIRNVRIKSYRLFYLVNEEKQEVQAISFLHSRQNTARQVARDLKLLF